MQQLTLTPEEWYWLIATVAALFIIAFVSWWVAIVNQRKVRRLTTFTLRLNEQIYSHHCDNEKMHKELCAERQDKNDIDQRCKLLQGQVTNLQNRLSKATDTNKALSLEMAVKANSPDTIKVAKEFYRYLQGKV